MLTALPSHVNIYHESLYTMYNMVYSEMPTYKATNDNLFRFTWRYTNN